MVKTSKRNLLTLTHLYLARVDEDSDQYARFCDILLTMMGVSDRDGNLTAEYADSPYWEGGANGEPLRPSARAEIKSMLPPELWGLLEPSEDAYQ